MGKAYSRLDGSPRVRAKLVTASLLVVAALAHLPIVYALVQRGAQDPVVALGFGFLAMGLGWAAGFVIEAKRRWFVLAASALGAAEIVIAFAPTSFDGTRPYMIGAGVLSAVALVLAVVRPPARAGQP